jgi:hypothetical protein
MRGKTWSRPPHKTEEEKRRSYETSPFYRPFRIRRENMSVKDELQVIEGEYSNAKAQAQSELSRYAELSGRPADPAAVARGMAEINRVHDNAIKQARERFYQAVEVIRASHAPLRHQVRKNISPEISPATAQHMSAALRGVKSVAEIESLWKDAQAAGDLDSCAFIEQKGASFLPETLAPLWKARAYELAISRAGEAGQHILDDERSISESFRELCAHATTEERSQIARDLNVKEQYLPSDCPVDLRLDPAPEIVLTVSE